VKAVDFFFVVEFRDGALEVGEGAVRLAAGDERADEGLVELLGVELLPPECFFVGFLLADGGFAALDEVFDNALAEVVDEAGGGLVEAQHLTARVLEAGVQVLGCCVCELLFVFHFGHLHSGSVGVEVGFLHSLGHLQNSGVW